VGIGPGAFTGLRVGIATARGLAQALDIPVAPVASLAALARGLDPGSAGTEEFLLAALDARRGELFAALYGRDRRELRPPFAGTPDRVAEVIRGAGGPVLAGGDGTVRFRAELEQAGARVIPDGDPRHTVSALQICLLGREAEAGRPESIEPIYLRRPDAELWRERNRDAAGERSR
jgi:tRNA threonylcarbamoyladenosine biosynthesis protein TsaB